MLVEQSSLGMADVQVTDHSKVTIYSSSDRQSLKPPLVNTYEWNGNIMKNIPIRSVTVSLVHLSHQLLTRTLFYFFYSIDYNSFT